MKVVDSLEDAEGLRCVDLFVRADGSYGFKEFRRDPEDAGRWTPVGDYSGLRYPSADAALAAAAAAIAWFDHPS
jgi:hypothetical protein